MDPDALADPLPGGVAPSGRCARSPSSRTRRSGARSSRSPASARCCSSAASRARSTSGSIPSRLRAYGLTVAEVTGAVANQNLQLPGGNVGQGSRELTVRMKGRVERGAESSTAWSSPPATAPTIRLEDVGTRRGRHRGGQDRRQHRRQAGRAPAPSASSRAPTRSRSIHGVKERLGEISPRLPAGYRLDVVRDESEYIEASVHDRPGAPRGRAPSWPPSSCSSSSGTGAPPHRGASPSPPPSSAPSR